MKIKERIPEERSLTIRAEILRLLEDGELTVGELSKAIRKSEKELYDHLQHLLWAKSLVIIPAECLKCGYRFSKREKVKKPGKCPLCKGTHIRQPLFTLPKNEQGT
ncbi:MAG: ArsR family transcriptional regulator [Proteobacteria bacterium]|nr:ArsR family transcriptional regulator [Pseudomonadota bacterium]MBU1139976.1 ArsR family transcriptional regulator [Pseudomonadota bacterium]